MSRATAAAAAAAAVSLLLLASAEPASAQGVLFKDGSGATDLWTVSTTKSALVASTQSSPGTFDYHFGAGIVTAANVGLILEAQPNQGFYVNNWCVVITNPTAAAGGTISLIRTTRVLSSGGTSPALTDGTGTHAITSFNAARDLDPFELGAYPGTSGRGITLPVANGQVMTLDQVGFQTGEQGAGAADYPGTTICKSYTTDNGMERPRVAQGLTNGIFLRLSTLGAGAANIAMNISVSVDQFGQP